MLTSLLNWVFINISLHLKSLFLNFKVLNKHNSYKIITFYELHVLTCTYLYLHVLTYLHDLPIMSNTNL